MNIESKYLEISFEGAGIRNSQKRLKELINTLAVDPLKEHQDSLMHRFNMVEDILAKRIANVIGHWLQHKHEPTLASLQDMMSDLTNATKNDMTLEAFYLGEVRSALYSVAPIMGLDMPDDYNPKPDELEYVLLLLEEKFEQEGPLNDDYANDADDADADADGSYGGYDDADADYADEHDAIDSDTLTDRGNVKRQRENVFAFGGFGRQSNGGNGNGPAQQSASKREEPALAGVPQAARANNITSKAEKAIISAPSNEVKQVGEIEVDIQEQPIHADQVNLSAEQAWQLTYKLMGYGSDYIQQTMLPRWQQYPAAFDKDRTFLYRLFVDTIQKSAGLSYIAGNFRFVDRALTVDQLWQHYFSDLSQRVAPQLAAAQIESVANEKWQQKWLRWAWGELRKVSAVWLLALAIALIFDGLTTFISLDQTPMEGPIVLIFTVLITALFQIADQLVINYRKREFEAEAMSAKYRAQFERFEKTLSELDTTSDSYVQLSMKKSQSHADWKAAEDNRKMARRGRFWSARIADINVIVTAYGFAYLFLNAEEPVYALIEQIDVIFVKNNWELVNLWVFLMVGLAVTVSFVINTAQRTEIMGWSMRRLKNEV
jgi:hypothetical protein